MVVISLCATAAGIWITHIALEARHTGEPIYSTDRGAPTDWWYWLAIGILTTLFGVLATASALGYIKPKQAP